MQQNKSPPNTKTSSPPKGKVPNTKASSPPRGKVPVIKHPSPPRGKPEKPLTPVSPNTNKCYTLYEYLKKHYSTTQDLTHLQ